MAITYVGAGAVGTVASGNFIPVLSGSETQDDILICKVEASDNVVLTFPAGWTKFIEGNNTGTGRTMRTTYAWKKYDTGDGPPTVTHAAGSFTRYQIATFRGVDTTNPIDVVSALQSNTGNSIAVPGITPTVDNFGLIVGGQKASSASAYPVLTDANLTFAEIAESASGSGDSFVWDYAIRLGSAVTVPSKTFVPATNNGTQDSMGVMFSLAPPTVPASPGDLPVLPRMVGQAVNRASGY